MCVAIQQQQSFSPPIEKKHAHFFVHHPFHFILFFLEILFLLLFIRCLSFSKSLSCFFCDWTMPSGTYHHLQQRHNFHHSQCPHSLVESVIGQFSKYMFVCMCECVRATIFVPIFFPPTKWAMVLNVNDVNSVHDHFECFLFHFHLLPVRWCRDLWVAFYLIVTFIRIRSEFSIYHTLLAIQFKLTLTPFLCGFEYGYCFFFIRLYIKSSIKEWKKHPTHIPFSAVRYK